MTIEQMREFVILAEERNYLVAADMLYSTQTTLSRHIMAMEKELGFTLFSRTTKRIELTQEGSRFLVYARRAVKLQDDYTAEIEWAKRSMSESLIVGYNALVTFYHFTEKLTQFMTDLPKIAIKIVEDETDQLIKAVMNGSCDIAFIQEDPFHPIENLDKLYIASDTMVAVLPSGHHLAEADALELTELRDDSFAIGFEDKPPTSVFIDACKNAGFEPHIARNGLVGPALFSWIGGSECVGLEWFVPAKNHQNERTTIVDITPTLRSYTTIIFKANRLSDTGRQLIEYFKADAQRRGYKNEI